MLIDFRDKLAIEWQETKQGESPKHFGESNSLAISKGSWNYQKVVYLKINIAITNIHSSALFVVFLVIICCAQFSNIGYLFKAVFPLFLSRHTYHFK